MELVNNILKDWKQKNYKPVYWFDGEEEYFIDQLIDYAESNILTEEEAQFNKDIFYGKDANMANIINACRQYPMFAEKRLVIVKEAQQLSKLDDLKVYLEKQNPNTILIFAHKEKKLDGKTSIAKLLNKQATVVSTKKIYDNQIATFATNLISATKHSIEPKALQILVNSIGNNLTRLSNEINKLCINIASNVTITADHIETFIGVSKAYNTFAFQDAVGKKDYKTMLTIINYFDANPKAAPMVLVMALLQSFFSKLFIMADLKGQADSQIASVLKIHPFTVKDYNIAFNKYGQNGVEQALLLLNQYSGKNVGIGANNTKDAELLKELCAKLMLCI
jgi:DNA polymerase III subunit delta